MPFIFTTIYLSTVNTFFSMFSQIFIVLEIVCLTALVFLLCVRWSPLFTPCVGLTGAGEQDIHGVAQARPDGRGGRAQTEAADGRDGADPVQGQIRGVAGTSHCLSGLSTCR